MPEEKWVVLSVHTQQVNVNLPTIDAGMAQPQVIMLSGTSSSPELRLGKIVAGQQSTINYVASLLAVLAVIVVLAVAARKPGHAMAIGMITSSSFLAAAYALRAGRAGLPFLASLHVQQGVFYGMPILVENTSIARYSDSTIYQAAIAFALFVVASLLSHGVVLKGVRARPSRYPLIPPTSIMVRDRTLTRLALLFTAAAITMNYLFFTGYYFQIFGSIGSRFYPVARAAAILVAICGAFLGGFSAGRSTDRRWGFWTLWSCVPILQCTSAMLSPVAGFVFATFVGLGLGSRRLPWGPIVAIVLVVGFLNQGKFEMRQRYWRDGTPRSFPVQHLPTFYRTWIDASLNTLAGQSDGIQRKDTGQKLTNRVDNLNMLLFAARGVETYGIPTLDGAGYTIIPSLLVPRFLWPGKPRTHEGQVMLNLRFQRQATRRETETTYIAWGLLPEAIGNFGIWFGPIALGVFLGASCGWLERWSFQKDLMSIEGLVACVAFVSFLVSFEMSMAVLVTSLCQSVCITIGGGLIMRQVLRSVGGSSK